MTDAEKDVATVVASVLADHVRADWSDRTYSCQGCRARIEAEVESLWPDAADGEERRELQSRYHRVLKPDWSLSEYNAHVTERVVDALATLPVTPSPKPAAENDPGYLKENLSSLEGPGGEYDVVLTEGEIEEMIAHTAERDDLVAVLRHVFVRVIPSADGGTDE